MIDLDETKGVNKVNDHGAGSKLFSVDTARLNVAEIVMDYLAKHGFDGLLNVRLNCECGFDDLMDCEFGACGCVPAYRHIDADGDPVFCQKKEIDETEDGHCIGCERECPVVEVKPKATSGYGRIKIGALIFQDFCPWKWPGCIPPTKEYEDEDYKFIAKDPSMTFRVKWINTFWQCKADGYGNPGNYGNGSIFVLDYDSIQLLSDEDDVEFRRRVIAAV